MEDDVVIKTIASLFNRVSNKDEWETFLQEILTEKERSDIFLRLALMKGLKEGKTQRSIASELHISLCKVTRGNKIIKNENSITNKLLERKKRGKKDE